VEGVKTFKSKKGQGKGRQNKKQARLPRKGRVVRKVGRQREWKQEEHPTVDNTSGTTSKLTQRKKRRVRGGEKRGGTQNTAGLHYVQVSKVLQKGKPRVFGKGTNSGGVVGHERTRLLEKKWQGHCKWGKGLRPTIPCNLDRIPTKQKIKKSPVNSED